jgi:hypothetical protein
MNISRELRMINPHSICYEARAMLRYVPADRIARAECSGARVTRFSMRFAFGGKADIRR